MYVEACGVMARLRVIERYSILVVAIVAPSLF